MIFGSFAIINIKGRFLFLKRERDALWDIAGGGFDINETDYKKVAIREVSEEAGIIIKPEQLNLIAVLSQKLKKEDAEKYRVSNGFLYLHSLFLFEETEILLSSEHTEYKLFEYKEIIEDYRNFKSGPLWMYFTFLEHQRTNKLQEGPLSERRFWQGKEYL